MPSQGLKPLTVDHTEVFGKKVYNANAQTLNIENGRREYNNNLFLIEREREVTLSDVKEAPVDGI